MSTHNIGFYGELTKIIFQLSSNAHLIYSSGRVFRDYYKINAKVIKRSG